MSPSVLLAIFLPTLSVAQTPLRPPLLDKGWNAVVSIPLWPRATDPSAMIVLVLPPKVGLRYSVRGKTLISTGTSANEAGYAYRLVGWTKEDAKRTLGNRATNRRGELCPLIGVRIERRPR